MLRKDCDNRMNRPLPRGKQWRRACAFSVWLAPLVFVTLGATLQAGTVRLWPRAVVVKDTVTLADVAELKGFDAETERILRAIVVASAPAAGGSRLIHIDTVRQAFIRGGGNMAKTLIIGSTQCALRRPVNVTPIAMSATSLTSFHANSTSDSTVMTPSGQSGGGGAAAKSMRQAIVDHFNRAYLRYKATADVIFTQAEDQLLGLTEPTYQFHIRPRTKNPVGLIQLEVDLLAGGQRIRTIPMVVQVSMNRRELVARRAINQGAVIRAGDVDISTITRTRLDRLGLIDASLVIGQRAKKFISAGTVIHADMYAAVPLVRRGELVTLTSLSRGVRIVTSVKALSDGLLGETIRVRSTDNRRLVLDARVIGPASVQVGGRFKTRVAANQRMGVSG